MKNIKIAIFSSIALVFAIILLVNNFSDWTWYEANIWWDPEYIYPDRIPVVENESSIQLASDPIFDTSVSWVVVKIGDNIVTPSNIYIDNWSNTLFIEFQDWFLKNQLINDDTILTILWLKDENWNDMLSVSAIEWINKLYDFVFKVQPWQNFMSVPFDIDPNTNPSNAVIWNISISTLTSYWWSSAISKFKPLQWYLISSWEGSSKYLRLNKASSQSLAFERSFDSVWWYMLWVASNNVDDSKSNNTDDDVLYWLWYDRVVDYSSPTSSWTNNLQDTFQNGIFSSVLSNNNIVEKTKPQVEASWDWIEFNLWEAYLAYISDISKKYSWNKVNNWLEGIDTWVWISAWTISLFSVDNSDIEISDNDKNILADTTTDFIASFEIKATDENIIVKELTIDTYIDWINTDLSDYIEKLYIYADDKITLLADEFVTDSNIEFTNIDHTIWQTTSNIYIKAKLKKIWDTETYTSSETQTWFTLWIDITNALWINSSWTIVGWDWNNNISISNPISAFWTKLSNIVATKLTDVSLLSEYNWTSVSANITNWNNTLAILKISAASSSNNTTIGNNINAVIRDIIFDIDSNDQIWWDLNISNIKIEKIWWSWHAVWFLNWTLNNEKILFTWYELSKLASDIELNWNDTYFKISSDITWLQGYWAYIQIWMKDLNNWNIMYESCKTYNCYESVNNAQEIYYLNLFNKIDLNNTQITEEQTQTPPACWQTETSALTINSLSSTREVVIWTEDIVALDFNISAWDWWITKLSSLDISEASGFTWFTNNAITEIKLWEKQWTNESLIASRSYIEWGTAPFNSLNVLIPKLESKRFIVTVSLLDDSNNSWLNLNLKVSNINLNDNCINNIPISPTEATSERTITIVWVWILQTFAIDNYNDVMYGKPQNLLAGETTDFLASFELKASNEDITMKSVSLDTYIDWELSDLSDKINSFTIYWDDKVTPIGQESVNGVNTEFLNINHLVWQTTSNIYIKANLLQIGDSDSTSSSETTTWFTIWMKIADAQWFTSWVKILWGVISSSSDISSVNHLIATWSNVANIVATKPANVELLGWYASALVNWDNDIAFVKITPISNSNATSSWNYVEAVLQSLSLNIGLEWWTDNTWAQITSATIKEINGSTSTSVTLSCVDTEIAEENCTIIFPTEILQALGSDIELSTTRTYKVTVNIVNLDVTINSQYIQVSMDNLDGTNDTNVTYKSCKDYTCAEIVNNSQTITSMYFKNKSSIDSYHINTNY